jgi:hypothetical protein
VRTTADVRPSPSEVPQDGKDVAQAALKSGMSKTQLEYLEDIRRHASTLKQGLSLLGAEKKTNELKLYGFYYGDEDKYICIPHSEDEHVKLLNVAFVTLASLADMDVKVISADLVTGASTVNRQLLPFFNGVLAWCTSQRQYIERITAADEYTKRGYLYAENYFTDKLCKDKEIIHKRVTYTPTEAIGATWSTGQSATVLKITHLLDNLLNVISAKYSFNWKSYLLSKEHYLSKVLSVPNASVYTAREYEFIKRQIGEFRRKAESDIDSILNGFIGTPANAISQLQKIIRESIKDDLYKQVRENKDRRVSKLMVTVKKGKETKKQLVQGANLLEKIEKAPIKNIGELISVLWTPLVEGPLSDFTKTVLLLVRRNQLMASESSITTEEKAQLAKDKESYNHIKKDTFFFDYAEEVADGISVPYPTKVHAGTPL